MESLNIVFTGKNQVECWKEPVAQPVGDEVLIQTEKTLISTGTECIVLGQKFDPGTHWAAWGVFPFYPGYLNAGRVIGLGPDVKHLKKGDRVATRWQHRQYFSHSEAQTLRIPDALSAEEASWFGLATIVQNGVRRAAHELGDVVVVIGLGLLGQLVVQYARASGAREVIAIDLSQPRLAMAASHGATHTLEMGVADAREKIAELTGGRMADVVYDVTGFAPVLSPALALARTFGKVIILGDTGTPSEQRLTVDVVTRGLQIIGAHDGNPPEIEDRHHYWTKPHMAEMFYSFLERGQMKVNDLVTHRFKPEQAAEAYHLLQTDRSGAMGVIFDFSG